MILLEEPFLVGVNRGYRVSILLHYLFICLTAIRNFHDSIDLAQGYRLADIPTFDKLKDIVEHGVERL